MTKYKVLLAKIKTAQLKYKKILKLKFCYSDLLLLNSLWKRGFIYGYNKGFQLIIIFLKYSLLGFGLLSKIKFVCALITKKELNSLLFFEPYCSFLIVSSNGIISYEFKRNTLNKGGFLVAKI